MRYFALHPIEEAASATSLTFTREFVFDLLMAVKIFLFGTLRRQSLEQGLLNFKLTSRLDVLFCCRKIVFVAASHCMLHPSTQAFAEGRQVGRMVRLDPRPPVGNIVMRW